jgi:hypothetical protein
VPRRSSVYALTPAIRRTFLRANHTPADADQPSWEQVLKTLAHMVDRTLTPPGGADLAAGTSLVLSVLDRSRGEYAARHVNLFGRVSLQCSRST